MTRCVTEKAQVLHQPRRSVLKKIFATAAMSLSHPQILFGRELWVENPSVLNRLFNLLHIHVPKRWALITSQTELTLAFLHTTNKGHGFRIQSRGHCFAGHSRSDDILFDLRNLNAASVGDVIAATAPHNLALPAGYCQTVSIGGHVTGGSIGVLSRRYGLACDQLVSARILTVNGQITDISKEEMLTCFEPCTVLAPAVLASLAK